MATNYNDYSKTTWINSSAPALNETNLNKIEQGIYDNRENTQELNTNIQTLEARGSYSTNEAVIGTWIDNKPIYRKVYKITSGLPGVDTGGTVNVSDLSIDRCISLRGWTYSTTFGYIDMYFYNTSFNMMYLTGNTQINYKYHWATTELYIIIEYTKTTD